MFPEPFAGLIYMDALRLASSADGSLCRQYAYGVLLRQGVGYSATLSLLAAAMECVHLPLPRCCYCYCYCH